MMKLFFKATKIVIVGFLITTLFFSSGFSLKETEDVAVEKILKFYGIEDNKFNRTVVLNFMKSEPGVANSKTLLENDKSEKKKEGWFSKKQVVFLLLFGVLVLGLVVYFSWDWKASKDSKNALQPQIIIVNPGVPAGSGAAVGAGQPVPVPLAVPAGATFTTDGFCAELLEEVRGLKAELRERKPEPRSEAPAWWQPVVSEALGATAKGVVGFGFKGLEAVYNRNRGRRSDGRGCGRASSRGVSFQTAGPLRIKYVDGRKK